MRPSLPQGLSYRESALGLEICLTDERDQPSFGPDFVSEKTEKRIKDELRRRSLLLRAIEGKKKSSNPLVIFDFYSGFGGEAFLMAAAGHKVFSCEKNPVISFVVRHNWEKAKKESWVQNLSVNLRFFNKDSRLLLNSGELPGYFDVIYMDPMFDKLKSSAKSPLPMQIAQRLTEEDKTSIQEDFTAAKQKTSKIVMKLPLKGHPLIDEKPTYQLQGKTIRFDIYQS